MNNDDLRWFLKILCLTKRYELIECMGLISLGEDYFETFANKGDRICFI